MEVMACREINVVIEKFPFNHSLGGARTRHPKNSPTELRVNYFPSLAQSPVAGVSQIAAYFCQQGFVRESEEKGEYRYSGKENKTHRIKQ